jgi:hypothetical protein
MVHCNVLTMQGNLQCKKLFGSYDSFQSILIFAFANKHLHIDSTARCVLLLAEVVAKDQDK